RHVYFRGIAAFWKFADGEYRGTPGQYTLLPPSQHPSGLTYRWLIPLPEGDLPLIDPFEVGLCNRENAESAADTSGGGNGAVSSLLASSSVSPLLAPSSASSVLQAIENAILATLPTSEGQRNRCIFRFARHLKGIQSLRNESVAALRPFVEQWHQRALAY